LPQKRTVRPIDRGGVSRHSHGIVHADTLKLIVLAPRRRPSHRLHRRLDDLLRRLADAASTASAEATQDEIWRLWMSYPDRQAAAELERATRAIVAEDFAAAERMLHRLVALHPGFAEAWHKRGTLFYMQARDEESVRDFHHTLALEPRHFGAMLAFAELCIAAGRKDDALFALDVALRHTPHLAASRASYDALLAERPGTGH
jgi:predicted Zn-dependent protease